jgi:hypothetical protein
MLDSDGESSLKTIGQQAFADCTNLKYIVLPDSVEVLRANVFAGCDNLTLCYSESADTTDWYDNWNYSFNGTIIDDYAASEGLEYFMTSDTTCEVKSIGTCTDSDVVIPVVHEGALVTGIGQRAFDGSQLTAVTIPDSVEYLGTAAFINCNLTSITIPSSVAGIANDAFAGCVLLTSVIIEKGVGFIGDSAFSGCVSLTVVNIPSGVTAIHDNAFEDCSGLTKVTIPTTVTLMGTDVFVGCNPDAKIHLGWKSSVHIPSGWNANWNPVPCKVVYTRPPKRY